MVGDGRRPSEDRGPGGRLLALVSLRRGEASRALLTLLYLFLIIAAYVLLKAIRTALFISEFGAMKLPYVMLGIAVMTGALVSVYIRLARRMQTSDLTAYSILFFASNVLLFWWLALRGERWLYPLLYVWSGMFGVIATTQVWTLANELFTVREAKRTFGVVGAGGSLGAAAGGWAAFCLAPRIGTTHLLLVVVALLLAAAGTVWALSRLRTAQEPASRAFPPPRNLAESLGTIAGSGHLRLLAGLVFIAALATTTVDFQFNVVASEKIGDRDALTAFFGAVHGSTSVVAFLLQVLATGRVLSHFGVGVSILVLPLSLLSGSTALALSKTVWAGVFLKGSDGALKHSLDRACRELMYVPVPSSVRVQTKSTIDTVMDRLGDGVAGAVQLVIIEGFGWGLPGSLALNFLVVGLWISMALRLRWHYVAQLRQTLRAHDADPEQVDGLAAEGDARRVVERLLETGSADEKLACLEWAARTEGRVEEQRLLYLARNDPSPEVRHAALSALLGGPEGDLPDDLADAVDRGGQAALVAAIDLVVETDRGRLDEKAGVLLDQAGEASRLPLLAFMLRRLGPAFEPFAARVFGALLAPDAAPPLRRAAVRTLGLLPPGSSVLQCLDALLADPDPEIAAAAVDVAALHGRGELIPRLVDLLQRPRVRSAARGALGSFGIEAVAPLIDALTDPHRLPAVRRHVPRILGSLATPRAVGVLVAGLRDLDPLVADGCLRAVSALSRRIPRPRALRSGDLARETLEQIRRVEESERMREALLPGDTGPVAAATWLLEALASERRRGLAAVFGILALEHPPLEIQRIERAIEQGNRIERANAIELLANLLPREIHRCLLPLLEHEARASGMWVGGKPLPSREDAIRLLAESPRPWIAATALHAGRTLGAAGIGDLARRASASRDPLVREEAAAVLSDIEQETGP